ncbi:MAG: flagellar biosynthesis protein FlhF [Sterolibacteriaceae bacterium]|nr:flagellar biosynthesis protein FlhF [Sterolibacteriaceae bacterium]MBK9085507.1 flagellar biosynthesis protein FlhF [Sterolibacteriaceae bacterium]
MNVKRFFGETARDALRQVKEALGADAIVLSNRQVDGGVEILALPPEAAAALASPRPAEKQQARAASGDDDFKVSLSASVDKRFKPGIEPQAWKPRRVDAPKAAPAQPATARGASVAARYLDDQSAAEPVAKTAAASEPAVPSAQAQAAIDDAAESARMIKALSAQVGEMRGLLESQLAGFAWGEMSRNAPARTQIMSELLEAGFSAQLSRELTGQIAPQASQTEARANVREALSRGLSLIRSDADIIDRGGVYAIVGPTGVGKTTTTAKLAARCVVRHGAENLALITTDSYRIGAHEQLRIYGRILGVTVHVVRDAVDLRTTLRDLAGKHMVLIDTVGMSQRDQAVAEQAAMLNAAGEVRRLLLLNAIARGDTLDDVVRAYAGKGNGADLAGVVLTKVDEAASLAPVLDVAIRHQLDVFYVANGQRVPEDLHLPNRAYLLHRALKDLPGDSPHQLFGDEAGLLLAAQRNSSALRVRGEVRHA